MEIKFITHPIASVMWIASSRFQNEADFTPRYGCKEKALEISIDESCRAVCVIDVIGRKGAGNAVPLLGDWIRDGDIK